ncbi:efflux transporter outer membrane subunit [Caulobacter sp. KR2-114]|uniref:efflux transporter outer membrane subunit n=1 Tax=Caulobacter sp. KR2-114 TaxID=3400912 RepID=UPI003BFBC4D4
MMRRLISILLAGAALSACTLAPKYERPALPVASHWPAAVTPANAGAAPAADLAWREVYLDPRLQTVIALALEQNRDLRVAIGNIEKARAQYGVQRADLLPHINAGFGGTRSRTPASLSGTGAPLDVTQYSASVGLASYEVDLFGRIRSLNEAALQSFFAAEENRRAAQISLIDEVATDYLSLAADQDLAKLAGTTLKSREDSERLTNSRFQAGAASELDLNQAQTLTEQARTDLATATARVNQDLDALRLVVGAEIPQDQLPDGDVAGVRLRQDLPPGLPSDVLTRRPDVLSAEHTLRGQNADIGAARAAFFPKITLTGSAGTASPDLSGLFAPGSGAWSFAPQISVPLFAGGANVANLKAAEASRDIAVAQYEKAVQTAFRDVADALAVQATIDQRLASQERLVAAAENARRLSQARYERGVDNYLTLLDAERTLFAAQQTLISTRLAQAANRVSLYSAVGGGADH